MKLFAAHRLGDAIAADTAAPEVERNRVATHGIGVDPFLPSQHERDLATLTGAGSQRLHQLLTPAPQWRDRRDRYRRRQFLAIGCHDGWWPGGKSERRLETRRTQPQPGATGLTRNFATGGKLAKRLGDIGGVARLHTTYGAQMGCEGQHHVLILLIERRQDTDQCVASIALCSA